MAAGDSTSGKSPAFQFYPNDFLSDANVIVMSLHERGAYITLLCVCWQQGSLPNHPEQLARFCGVPLTAFRKLWPAVEKCFRLTSDGARLVNPRLERERRKQRDYRKAQSDKGKLGGRPKKPELSTEKATAFENKSQSAAEPESQTKAEKRSSFSSSSSDFRQREIAPPARKPVSLSGEDELSERAGRFIERYQALYTKHRKGAHYLPRPTLDYAKAIELCRTWDDGRLDQLAVVFLTTDHRFAEEGSRTIGQFAALASWCDGRLAEAGIA